MLIIMTNLTHPDNIVSRQHHVQYVQTTAWRFFDFLLLLYKFAFTCLCCKIILCLICMASLMIHAFRLNIVFSLVISNYVHSTDSFFLCFFLSTIDIFLWMRVTVVFSSVIVSVHSTVHIFFFFHYGHFSQNQTENYVLISDYVSAFHCQFFALTVVFHLVLVFYCPERWTALA